MEGKTMCEAIAATTAATAARLERPAGLDDHFRHMLLLSEFMDSTIVFSDTDEEPKRLTVEGRNQRKLHKCLKKLTGREDFRFYFYNNQAIKQSVLSAVAALFKFETQCASKLDALQLLDELIGTEIDISRAQFLLNESSRSLYNSFYGSIVHDIDMMITGMSRSGVPTTKIESFISHLCYMLICLPVDYQSLRANTPLLYKVIDFLLDLNMCPHLASKAHLSIAVNICNKTSEMLGQLNIDADNDLECDMIKIELYERCSMRCVDLLSSNMRDKECRVSLKKALEIYCSHLPNRLNYINNCVIPSSWVNCEAEQLDLRMNQLLYQIVISIVRVLRSEFENHDESIDIELVIYFYEIIKQNLDNLTEEDAYDLAKKLMDIITKIEDWSERYRSGFNLSQLAYLNELSFDLVIKFIHILKHEFCQIHWKVFKSKWTKSILNWEPLAYKAICTLCQYIDMANFDYIRKLTRRVRNSWLGHPSDPSSMMCGSSIKAKQEFDMFLDPEILTCVAKLISMYDEGVRHQLWYLEAFRTDLLPVLDIIGHLFSSIRCREKMLKCCNFYLFFSNLVSSPLRDQRLWTPHIELLMYNTVQIINEKTRFDLDEKMLEAVVKIVKVSFDIFDSSTCYKHVLTDLISFVKRNCHRINLGPETERDLVELSLFLDQ